MGNKIKKLVLANKWLTTIALGIRRIHLKQTVNIRYGKNVKIGFSTICEGSNSFADHVSIMSSFIGFASYIGHNSELTKTKIGRFSSIGPRLNCIFGKHPSHTFVSTHPAFFSPRKQAGFTYTKKQLFPEFEKPRDPDNKYSIIIGNDVWIGANVSIMEGVSIGHGAIIASNSLVNKDVPPYTIVGGVPAKIIKKRFTDSQIDFLLRFKWWDKDLAWIEKNSDKFIEIEKFQTNFENE